MSYVSILKNIPEFLSQPAGIAAIASVGIHGAIAFILPLMPVESDSGTTEQTVAPTKSSVGIMELSEAEKNRLPQQQRPQVSALPKTPQAILPLPNFATKPTPLAKLPPNPDSTSVTLPPLPRSSANPNISSLPKRQSLPILPQPNFDSSFNAKAQSSGSYRRFSKKMEIGRSLPSAPRTRNVSPKRPTVARLPKVPPVQAAAIPPELSRIPTPPPLPPMTNPGIGVGQGVAINQQMYPPVTNNNVPVNPPARINPQDFVAPMNRNIPKPGDNLTLAGQSFKQWGQQSGPRRVELPNQPLNNSNTAATQNTNISPQNTNTLTLAKQFEEVQGRYSNLEEKVAITDVVKTKPGKEGKAVGTLVIDSDGKADYLKFVDRSIPSKLKKETRNYFRRYFKENPIQKNGNAKVYAFSLDFKSDAVDSAELSKPQEKLVNRLRNAKDDDTQINLKPLKKEPEISRSSVPIKVDSQPTPNAVVDSQPTRNAVVVPIEKVPAKVKPQVEIRTKKPASSNSNDKPPLEVRLRNTQEVPKVPSLPKPQARVNVQEPAPQATKPSIVTRIRNGKEDSEDDSEKTSGSSKKLIQRLRKIQERRENSN